MSETAIAVSYLLTHVGLLVAVVCSVNGADLADAPAHALLLLVHLGGPQHQLHRLVRDQLGVGKGPLSVAGVPRSAPAGIEIGSDLFACKALFVTLASSDF